MTKFKTFSENQCLLKNFKTCSTPCLSLRKVGGGGGGGGGTESFGVVLTRELADLAILNGGAKHFHPFKGGMQNVLPS